MEAAAPRSFAFSVDAEHTVSALLNAPHNARAGCVLAHGAGAGMAHPFMAAVASGLAERGVATLRYQFPYMERGSKRPDGPALAHATVRAAVAEASQRLPQLALFGGGKSFGGRMTSQAHAASPLPGVRGIVFFGFPLHPAKQPSSTRAQHLFEVHSPMLFLQGTRDELADDALVRTLIGELGPRATLETIPQADHSFHVPARSGRKDAAVLSDMLDATVRWIDRLLAT
ncbi:alpha/beta family hydrolase [Piscinibacter sp.]|uniref:alpha/beta hydrolase family protein n=1 Tax=Piscinibacter sp. TaxID=1903157 RepID=UPI002C2AB9BB|nr:alpha/beta family hydrolase [Albitalea sp.]HUG23553.1 alpha/beta family hydrolase [Albitalea sp.]